MRKFKLQALMYVLVMLQCQLVLAEEATPRQGNDRLSHSGTVYFRSTTEKYWQVWMNFDGGRNKDGTKKYASLDIIEFSCALADFGKPCSISLRLHGDTDNQPRWEGRIRDVAISKDLISFEFYFRATWMKLVARLRKDRLNEYDVKVIGVRNDGRSTNTIEWRQVDAIELPSNKLQ